MQTSANFKNLELFFQKLKESSQNTEQLADFYEELETLISTRIVQAARYLLDNQTIVVYSNTKKTRFLAEIFESHNSKSIVRLFPCINYCPCEYFRFKVLQHGDVFTCEHVLALRLAYTLTSDCIRYETLSQEQFNTLLSEPLCTVNKRASMRKSTMLSQAECSNYKFVGCLDNIKGLTAGIRALNFGDHGSFQINEDGFRCTVEYGKCIQANLFITPMCFAEFYINGVVNFTIDMNVLTECLNIFAGIDCGIRMFYKEQDAPLIIILEPHDEDDITTECSIKTAHHDEIIDFTLDEDSTSLNTVFIRGPDLYNLFHEFDKSSEELEFTLSPRRPHFKIDNLGVVQSESSVEVAKTSDMMILFKCKATTKAKYKSSLMRMTQKAMSGASKVAIKTDSGGLLEMHFMMQDTDRAEIYVQFYITPMVDTEL